jgi:hypothetical protein
LNPLTRSKSHASALIWILIQSVDRRPYGGRVTRGDYDSFDAIRKEIQSAGVRRGNYWEATCHGLRLNEGEAFLEGREYKD